MIQNETVRAAEDIGLDAAMIDLPKRYFHGTSITREESIDREGLGAPAVYGIEQRYECDPNAIYFSDEFLVAVIFGMGLTNYVLVYEIEGLPDDAAIERDSAGELKDAPGRAFKVITHKRIRPVRKCVVSIDPRCDATARTDAAVLKNISTHWEALQHDQQHDAEHVEADKQPSILKGQCNDNES